MELLVARELTLSLGGRSLFEDLGFSLGRGQRIGLIGASGSGRTMLLALLAGQRSPDSGTLVRAPGVRIELVSPQIPPPITVAQMAARAQGHLRDLETALRAEERRLAAGEAHLDEYARLLELFEQAGGYRAEAAVRSALESFGVPQERWQRRADTLSGGELRSVQLALALATQPDVLLLDEPTRHLDLLQRQRLAERLARFPGGLLLASHDRALLDRVCSHIALLSRGRLEVQRGTWATFERRRSELRLRDARRARENAREQRKIAETVAQLRSFGTRAASRRRKRFERRLAQLRTGSEAERPAAPAAALEMPARSGSGAALTAEHLTVTYGERTVLADLSLTVPSGERVALIGANGSGKSTLLALLAGEIASDDGRARLRYGRSVRLGHLDQRQRGIEAQAAPFEILERVAGAERAASLLSALAVPADRWHAPARSLSAGERTGVGLARLAASEANLLLLDEPDADLDLAGIERLERTLLEIDATLLFSCHDERLIERVATRVWSLVNGELTEYRGGFAGYLRGARRLEPDLPPIGPGGGDGAGPFDSDARPETDSPPDPAAALEDELAAIERALSDPLLLSERVLARYRQRGRELIEDLSLLFEERSPPAPLRFAAREAGLEVRAEPLRARSGQTIGLEIDTPLPLPIEVFMSEGVAHLRLRQRRDLCPLDWAVAAVVTACARLCLYLLPIRAVQLQYAGDLSDTPFTPAGHDWWLLSRTALERSERWRREA